MYFCPVCGAYATERPQLLLGHCRGSEAGGTAIQRKRIQQGLFPSYGPSCCTRHTRLTDCMPVMREALELVLPGGRPERSAGISAGADCEKVLTPSLEAGLAWVGLSLEAAIELGERSLTRNRNQHWFGPPAAGPVECAEAGSDGSADSDCGETSPAWAQALDSWDSDSADGDGEEEQLYLWE